MATTDGYPAPGVRYRKGQCVFYAPPLWQHGTVPKTLGGIRAVFVRSGRYRVEWDDREAYIKVKDGKTRKVRSSDLWPCGEGV